MPERAETYIERGLLCQQQGAYDQALADFTRAIELAPDAPDGYGNRGCVRSRLGDHEGAIADLTAAITADPGHFDSLYNRAIVHRKRRDFTAALADLDRCARLDPQVADVHSLRGKICTEAGRLPEALAGFDEAVRLDRLSPVRLADRAEARRLLGDLAGTVEDYGGLILMTPREPTLFFNRALDLIELGRLDDAVRDLTAYLGFISDDYAAYWERAQVHGRLGDRVRQAEDLRRVISLAPDDFDGLPAAKETLNRLG